MKAYLIVFVHSIAQNNSLEWLDFAGKCVEVLVGIIAIIGGVVGLFYLNKQRERRRDASFGYMAQLSVHIQNIKMIFENESDKLLNQLVCPNNRIPLEEFLSANHEAVATIFKKRVEETLNFLMNTDNQMPVYEGWTERMSKFLGFLEDFSFVFNTDGFLWQGDKTEISQEKNKYKQTNIDNMVEMLKDIETYQKTIESKIAKKRENKREKAKKNKQKTTVEA